MQELREITDIADRRNEEIEEVEERKPLVKSPALVSMIIKEFKAMEKIEKGIADGRNDIKEIEKRLVERGLNRKGIKAARARRKLARGGLEEMDETLMLICGIASLGIQGELFLEEGGDAAA